MPIIKDKYAAKGSQTRSKFVTRKFRKAVKTETMPVQTETTEQKQALVAQEVRLPGSTILSAATGTTAAEAVAKVSTITGNQLSVINTVENVFTLQKGYKLEDIIISHNHATADVSVVSLHWSKTPFVDLEFTVSSGIITATTGGSTYRLLSDTFTSNSTLSIADSGLFNSFKQFNNDIYFYAVCSVLGPEITIISSDG